MKNLFRDIAFFIVSIVIIVTLIYFDKAQAYKKSYKSSSRIHNVKPYITKKGRIVGSHISANPKSHLKCRKNLCY